MRGRAAQDEDDKPLDRAVFRRLVVLVAIVAVVGLLILSIIILPSLLVPYGTVSPVTRLKAQNDVRSTILQGFAGVVLLLGAYFTWRQLTLQRSQQATAAEQSQYLARELAITDALSKAVVYLGDERLIVRLGGIYTLERIYKDSPADRAAIGEILTAYLRQHSPWAPSSEEQFTQRAPGESLPKLSVRAPDVQAVLTVLARNSEAGEGYGRVLDFSQTDLRRADLNRGRLIGANFSMANLEGSDFAYAELSGCNFTLANLANANLIGADLEAAIFQDANLAGANLARTRLVSALLTAANLSGALLAEANLQGALLADAKLRSAVLTNARLEDALLAGADLEDAVLDRASIDEANLGSTADTRPRGLTQGQLESASSLGGKLIKRGDH